MQLGRSINKKNWFECGVNRFHHRTDDIIIFAPFPASSHSSHLKGSSKFFLWLQMLQLVLTVSSSRPLPVQWHATSLWYVIPVTHFVHRSPSIFRMLESVNGNGRLLWAAQFQSSLTDSALTRNCWSRRWSGYHVAYRLSQWQTVIGEKVEWFSDGEEGYFATARTGEALM